MTKGRLAEWSNAPHLKCGMPQGIGGSNPPPSAMKKFSIIIPAWNEENSIGKTIAGARALDYPRADFEIIAVDNNSSDKTSEAARAAGADKVILETEQGTNMARNAGLRASEGDVVAFLDSDCVPPPNWLRQIEKHFENPEVVAVSGPYDHGFTGILKLLERFYMGYVFALAPKIVTVLFRKKDAVMMGGNFAVRRSAIKKIGEFPRLAFYGDDTAIAVMLARNAGEVVFDPDFVVKSSPRRFKRQGLLRMLVRYAYHHFKVYFRLNTVIK